MPKFNVSWDLFANGTWIGMAEGDTAEAAIAMAKRCLPHRVERGDQLSVHRWYGHYDPRNHPISQKTAELTKGI